MMGVVVAESSSLAHWRKFHFNTGDGRTGERDPSDFGELAKLKRRVANVSSSKQQASFLPPLPAPPFPTQNFCLPATEKQRHFLLPHPANEAARPGASPFRASCARWWPGRIGGCPRGPRGAAAAGETPLAEQAGAMQHGHGGVGRDGF